MKNKSFYTEKKIDLLGRVVIPKELRDFYGINLGSILKLNPTDDGILITAGDDSDTQSTKKKEK